MTEVVAAIIRDEMGRILVCRRPMTKARGGMWEFVGGKVEAGETGEDALIRECKEELDISVEPKKVFCQVFHRYPDLYIRLTVYLTDIVDGIPQKLEHMELRWVYPQMLSDLDFCPADEEILRLIASGCENGLL